MTERKRLIELLEKAEEKVGAYLRENDHTDYIPTLKEICGVYADYLLANGTIALPCPIEHGDLFAIVDLYNRKKIVGQAIAKYEVDCIIIGHSQKPIYRCCNASNEWVDFEGDEISKTVFLTREEAEAALKERNKE